MTKDQQFKQECFTMAHMLRFNGDKFCLKTVLDKLKINY